MTRSRSSARRVRVLAAVVTVLVVVAGLAGIAGGAVLATFRRIDPGVTLLDGTVTGRSVTYPYVWLGVGVGVGSLVLMAVVLLFVESARMRAHVVLEADAARAAAGASNGRSYAGSPPVQPVQPVRPGGSSNGRRVLVLSDAQKERLALVPPPRYDEGWYPDPLDASALRRWNGAQWTGEQQSISLPPG